MNTLLILSFFLSLALVYGELAQIPLRHHVVSKEVLMKRQSQRLAKLGKSARLLRKYDSKLLDGAFAHDYVSARVAVGTPPQEFNVALSSGSTHLWVVNVAYNPDKYNPTISSTMKNLRRNFGETDGTFTARGQWVSDVMQFGKVKIPNQAFGSVSNITEPNNVDFPVDGVFGFTKLIKSAYDSNQEFTAPIDSLLKPLPKKIVSLYLSPTSVPSADGVFGSLTLGGVDSKYCEKSGLNMALIESKKGDKNYVLEILGVQYAEYNSENGYGLIDSGVSTLSFSAEIIRVLFLKIKPEYDWETGLYTVSCDSLGSLKPIIISAGEDITISPQSYVVDLGLDNGRCAVALSTNDLEQKDDESWVLGTPLFRESCVVFHYDENQTAGIGFYKHL